MPKTPERIDVDPARWSAVRLGHALFLLGLLACTAAAALRVSRGIAPTSLWLDDQWVAVLVRHASAADLLDILPPVPLGFIALLKLAALLGGGTPGDAAWPLQVFPLAAALVQIPLIGWLAWRATGSHMLGLLAAALLCESRTFLVQAVRIKQYTLEGLVALLLVCAAVHFVLRPSRARLLLVPLVAAASLPFSFTAVPVGMVCVFFVMVHAFCTAPRAGDADGVSADSPTGRQRNLRTLALVSGAAYGAIALLWITLVLLRQPNRNMGIFWSDHYLPVGDPAAFAGFFHTGALTMLGGAFPPGFEFLAIVVPLAIIAMVVRRGARLAGAAALCFFGGMLLASALHFYPIGGGRTDVFSYPITVLTLIGGLAAWHRPRAYAWNAAPAHRGAASASRAAIAFRRARQWCLRSPGRLAGGGVLALLAVRALLLFPGTNITYPGPGGRAAVEAAMAEHRPPGVLLISPESTWAFALYTHEPVTLLSAQETTNGFITVPSAAPIVQLRRLDEEGMRRQVDETIAGDPPRIVLLITFSLDADEYTVRTALTQAGYRETTIHSTDGLVLAFTRLPK